MDDVLGKPKVLFFVTEDWVFCSHRLALAVAALNRGYDVAVIARERNHGHIIREAGIRLIPLEISRRSINPISELMLIFKLFTIYRKERPDLVHHVALKPVLYGSIGALLAGVKLRVNALTGLGWVFISGNLVVKFLRRFIQLILRILLKHGRIIVQNPDDMAMLSNLGIKASNIKLIRGSGVDVTAFQPNPSKQNIPTIVLAARMLWDKGIGEFVEAARLIKRDDVLARFILVGSPDMENPAGIPESQLLQWTQEGVVEWWGYRADMADVYAQTTIACLPSYREGLPKSLLEAAACGLPIVTTDVPGCREVVMNNFNGLLVPPRDAQALAQALRILILDTEKQTCFGQRSRERALTEFSIEQVIDATLQIYKELMP